MPRGAPRLDRPCEVDGAAVEEEFFGERGLAGVRMRNNGECAPALDLPNHGCGGRGWALWGYRVGCCCITHPRKIIAGLGL